MISQFSFPTTIRFGPGARHEVRDHLRAERLQRPLIVTDRGVAPLPILAEMRKALAPLDVAVYSDVAGNPLEAHVTGGVDAYRAHRADCIVGFGGGAALDVAKAVAMMVHHDGSILDYEDGRPDARPIDRDVAYWVSVPTIAGTGSEVGRSTVVSDKDHVKRIVFSPKLLARRVFADPELTLAVPPKLTAMTGMDALTHCVESFLAKDTHPMCDGIALEGLRLVADALPRAVRDPHDLRAKSDLLMASIMGAVAFQKGLGVTHSCAHALSAVADLHHGFANAVMIDHALKMNAAPCADRFVRMANAARAPEPTPNGLLHWLRDLKAEIGIPAKLRDAGVREDQLPRLVAVALADTCHLNNPVPCARADFERIFREAF